MQALPRASTTMQSRPARAPLQLFTHPWLKASLQPRRPAPLKRTSSSRFTRRTFRAAAAQDRGLKASAARGLADKAATAILSTLPSNAFATSASLHPRHKLVPTKTPSRATRRRRHQRSRGQRHKLHRRQALAVQPSAPQPAPSSAADPACPAQRAALTSPPALPFPSASSSPTSIAGCTSYEPLFKSDLHRLAGFGIDTFGSNFGRVVGRSSSSSNGDTNSMPHAPFSSYELLPELSPVKPLVNSSANGAPELLAHALHLEEDNLDLQSRIQDLQHALALAVLPVQLAAA